MKALPSMWSGLRLKPSAAVLCLPGICSIVKSNSDKIAGIGWSDQEQLIIVLEDGTVLIYDTFGRLIKKLSMVDSTYPVQILECVYWGDGVVAICSDFQLHAIDGLSSLELSTIRRYICVFCNKQLYTKKG